MSDLKGLELLLKRIDKEEKSSVFVNWILDHELMLKGNRFSFKGFEELETIYRDMHPYKVFRKGVQIGITTWAILYIFWRAWQHSAKGIYYAPTKDFFKTFTPDRINNILNHFPEIKAALTTDSNNLKEFGTSVNFCGLNTLTEVSSIDADTLIFDEYDISDIIIAKEARDRLKRSSFPENHFISKPRTPGCGIDVEFQESDQHFRLMKCPKCRTWNDVIEHFPKNLLPDPAEKGVGYLACYKCSAKLDPTKAKWVAKKPGNKEKRGYHLTQLYSTWTPPGFNSTGDQAYRAMVACKDISDTKLLYNSFGGLPFAGALEPITDAVLNNLHGTHDLVPFANHSYMGYDQGDDLHIVIGHREEDMLVIHWFEKAKKFKRLYDLMQDHNVWCGVGDALPNKHSAKDWAFYFKGYAYIQYFSKEEKGTIKKGEETFIDENDEEQTVLTVSVNRTESLDITTEGLLKCKFLFPRRACSPEMETLRDHLKNLKKERTTDSVTGQVKEKYITQVPNHYAMALNSMRIASTLPVVQPFGLPIFAAGGQLYGGSHYAH